MNSVKPAGRLRILVLENIIYPYIALVLLGTIFFLIVSLKGDTGKLGELFTINALITSFIIISIFGTMFFLAGYPKYKYAFNKLSDILIKAGATEIKDETLFNRIFWPLGLQQEIYFYGNLRGRRIRIRWLPVFKWISDIELTSLGKSQYLGLGRRVSITKENMDKFIGIIPSTMYSLFEKSPKKVDLRIYYKGNITYCEGSSPMRAAVNYVGIKDDLKYITSLISGLEELAIKIESEPDLFKEYFK